MEIAFRGRALAGPAHGDAAVALDRRAHRPADRLRKLRAEIARNGEEAVRLVGIHDRELAALELVAFVRIDLAHHFNEGIAARDEQSLLTIGGEMHVLAVERGCGGDRDRLLAGGLHVEAGLPLPLRAVHAVVEDAHRDHVAEHLAQCVSVELRVPRTHGLVVVAEHADEVRGERMRFRRWSSDIGTRGSARRGNLQRREIRRVARPERRLGHMQGELRPVGPPLRGILVAHDWCERLIVSRASGNCE